MIARCSVFRLRLLLSLTALASVSLETLVRADWRETRDVRAVALDLNSIALNSTFVRPSRRADLPALFGSRFPAHDQVPI